MKFFSYICNCVALDIGMCDVLLCHKASPPTAR